MAESVQRKCPKCGELRDLHLFEYNPKTGRRNYSCAFCKQQKVNLPWDWACALRKSTRMHVGKAQGREGKYFDALDEDMIRALMRAQGNKCALTQAVLQLPSSDQLKVLSSDKTGNNVTLTAWKATLPPHLQKFVPVVVRVSTEGSWIPGNVVIICDYLKEFYEAAGNIGLLQDCCKLIMSNTPMSVPQKVFLDKIRQDILEENLKANL